MTAGVESELEDRLPYLEQSLLNHPIHDVGNAEPSLPAPWLWQPDAADFAGPVTFPPASLGADGRSAPGLAPRPPRPSDHPLLAFPCCAPRSTAPGPDWPRSLPLRAADWCRPRRRRDRSFSCASLFATESFAARMRPSAQPFRPPKGCRRTRSSIAGVPSFSIHLLLGSAGFHHPPRYYEGIRLLRGRRPVVVASFGSTARGGPTQTSLGNDTGCPAAPAPTTTPASNGFSASRSKTR